MSMPINSSIRLYQLNERAQAELAAQSRRCRVSRIIPWRLPHSRFVIDTKSNLFSFEAGDRYGKVTLKVDRGIALWRTRDREP